MKIISWLIKKIKKILPPDYGIYEKGSFPTKRKLSLRQAKDLILLGGKKERWQKETEINFEFLKQNFFEKRKNEEILILDYGIGIGRLALPILENYPKVKIIGLDESESMFELAKKWLPQVFFEKKRIELLKPDQFFRKYQKEKFDLILAVYIFQHIFLEELSQLLPKLYALLKNDGRIFIVGTFQNDDNRGRKIEVRPLLEKYFEIEKEISPYQNQEKYISWMKFAGYGDWQKMDKAKLRCQKFMGIFKKVKSY